MLIAWVKRYVSKPISFISVQGTIPSDIDTFNIDNIDCSLWKHPEKAIEHLASLANKLVDEWNHFVYKTAKEGPQNEITGMYILQMGGMAKNYKKDVLSSLHFADGDLVWLANQIVKGADTLGYYVQYQTPDWAYAFTYPGDPRAHTVIHLIQQIKEVAFCLCQTH